MNKQKLSEMTYKRIKTRPIARRIDREGRELPQIDYKWCITQASRDELNLFNDSTHHTFRLGTDHVHEYMTDIACTDGFLKLKSQIFLIEGRGVVVEPWAEAQSNEIRFASRREAESTVSTQ